MTQSDAEEKFRVLFVDDEQDLLDGLRQRLRKQRKIWSMSFACGATEALEIAEETHFDAVISDMRMPGMDGATFLNEFRRRQPGSLRVVLSGEADENTVTRSIPSVHQWHAKPCDVGRLVAMLQRSLEIRRAVGSAHVLSVLGESNFLPPLPATYQELLQLIERGDPSPDKLAEIVGRDPALAAKLLQVSNSAFFGLPQTTTTVSEALRFIGTDTMTRLVLSAEVFEHFSETSLARGFSFDRFLFRCTLVGRIAARLTSDETREAETFTVGLLHDVGLLVAAQRQPEAFERCLDAFRTGSASWRELELEHLGAQHSEIGAALFASWGLPSLFVESAYGHTQPDLGDSEHPQVPRLIHIADALASELIDRASGGPCALGGPLDPRLLAKGPDSREFEGWRTIAEEEYAALLEHQSSVSEGTL